MKTYKEAIRYLDSLVNYEKKGFKGGESFGLGNMRSALDLLGSPEDSFRCIHVAGTKGKGSVSVFAFSILRQAGMKTGLYTSPHLLSPRERIRLDGKDISEKDFAEGVFYLRRRLPRRILEKITYFEFLTLLAFWYFRKMRWSAAVLETGMGGRLDATNAVNSEVSVITPVSYDHTKILGKSLGKIAFEKAGIIKRRSVCVCSSQKRTALGIIKDSCRGKKARLILYGADIKAKVKEFSAEGSSVDIITPFGVYRNCRVGLAGLFQAENAALAAAAAGAFYKLVKRNEISSEAVKKGITKAFIPCRFEVLAENPVTVADGAQNAASCRVLASSVRKIFGPRKVILIAAFCSDKDIKGSCRALRAIADTVVATRARTARAADPSEIAGYFPGKNVMIARGAEEALAISKKMAGKNDIVLAAGSLYLAGEIRSLVKRKKRK